jgi:hypothetical protein
MFRQLPSVSVVSAQLSPFLPQLPSEGKRGREPAPHLRPIQEDLRNAKVQSDLLVDG